ncbi:hypothetical protein SAMN03159439_03241 [Pseudomonas sp. NFACC04-2]|nr:hypothetical protein SAMN03159439_03241 [Pseudomonas sp. NFACC04-2]
MVSDLFIHVWMVERESPNRDAFCQAREKLSCHVLAGLFHEVFATSHFVQSLGCELWGQADLGYNRQIMQDAIERSHMAIRISTMLFAITFPGTILYYVAVSKHLIPPISSGYFGLMCIVSLLLALPSYAYDALKTGRLQITDLSFFLFLLFFAMIVFWHGAQSSDKSLMSWHLVSIAQSVAVFLLCKRAFTNSDKISSVIAIGWLLASLCIMTVTVDGRFSLRETADDVGAIPSYQTFALCYMITSVFLAKTIDSRKLRYIVHSVSLICLYLNSARSEFAGYLFFLGVLEFLSYRNKSTPIIVASIVITISFVAIVTGSVKLPESRITALANLNSDNSSNERDRMAREGLDKIFNSPIIGAYGQYEEGGYIHNIMSVWQETGILGAIFFISILSAPTAMSIAKVLKRRSYHDTHVALSLLLTAILLLVAGKYFTYLLVPAALAVYSTTRNQTRVLG